MTLVEDVRRSEEIDAKVARLRERLRQFKAANPAQKELCNVVHGIIDLLGDEL